MSTLECAPAKYIVSFIVLAAPGLLAAQSFNIDMNMDWITIRYTGAGVFQWKRYVHGPLEPVNKDDAPTDIVVDSQNNVFMCGYVFNGANNPDMGTVSYNVNGLDRWNVPGVDRALEYSTRPGAGYDTASALDIEIDNTGAAIEVYVTGYGEPVIEHEYVTLRYSASLNTSTQTWARFYAGLGAGADESTDVTVAGNGNVYVTGFSTATGPGDAWDYATRKYNRDGVHQHTIRYTDNTAQPSALIDSCAGKTHVTGYRSTNANDFWTILYAQIANRTNIPITNYNVLRGSNPTGNLASMQTSDNSWFTVQPGVILITTDYPVTIIIDGSVADNVTVNELCLELEAHASQANAILQRVDFWNYATSSWVTMDERLATLTDSTVHLASQYDPNQFLGTPPVQGAPKPLKARVMFKQNGPVLIYPWTGFIDFVGWHSVD